jgi:hypothetical protein
MTEHPFATGGGIKLFYKNIIAPEAFVLIKGKIREIHVINRNCFQARLAGSNVIVQVQTVFPWVASRGDEIIVAAYHDELTGKKIGIAYKNLTTSTRDLPLPPKKPDIVLTASLSALCTLALLASLYLRFEVIAVILFVFLLALLITTLISAIFLPKYFKQKRLYRHVVQMIDSPTVAGSIA